MAISSTLSPSAAKSLLLKEFHPAAALSIISSLQSPSSSPASTRFAFHLAVRRLASSRRFADIHSLLESRKSLLPSSSHQSFLSTIILAYGAARMLPHAISTFNDIPRLCLSPPSTPSFNSLLSAALRANKPRRVPKLFASLSHQHSITPDAVSYGVLIKSLCLSGKAGKALEIMKGMEEKGVKATTFVYTTVIDSLYKRGERETAEEMWNEMRERGCKLDLAAYNVKIMDKANNGSVDDVLGLIEELKADGMKPDEISYNYLMTCYARAGRFEDMNEVYRGFRSKGNAATFRIMMSFLCEKGDFDAGFDVFRDSMKRNRIPDFRTLRPFVVGLVEKLKVEEAKMVISVVRQRFPESLVSGWKVLEEELGLNADGQTCDQVEAV